MKGWLVYLTLTHKQGLWISAYRALHNASFSQALSAMKGSGYHDQRY